jgi:hypothetical protein
VLALTRNASADKFPDPGRCLSEAFRIMLIESFEWRQKRIRMFSITAEGKCDGASLRTFNSQLLNQLINTQELLLAMVIIRCSFRDLDALNLIAGVIYCKIRQSEKHCLPASDAHFPCLVNLKLLLRLLMQRLKQFRRVQHAPSRNLLYFVNYFMIVESTPIRGGEFNLRKGTS